MIRYNIKLYWQNMSEPTLGYVNTFAHDSILGGLNLLKRVD